MPNYHDRNNSNLERNVLVLFEEHLELADADAKVPICELSDLKICEKWEMGRTRPK